MKHTRIFTAAAVAMVLLLSMALPASARSTNLLINSGFESSEDGGLTGWMGGNNNAQVTTAESYGGKASVLYQYNGNQLFYQSCPITRPGLYRLSAYVKVHTPLSGGAAAMGIRTRTRSGELGTGTITDLAPVLVGNWTKVTAEVNVSSEIVSLEAAFFNSHPSGAYYIDDVTLTQGGDPLLQNGNFEQTLSGWNTVGTGGAILTTGEQAYSGAFSALFSYFTLAGMENYLQQSKNTGAGTYQLTAMVFPDATLKGVGAMLLLEARDKDGKVLADAASPAVSSPAGQWQALSVSLTAPGGTAEIVVKIGGVYCTGAFYVDDVLLTKSSYNEGTFQMTEGFR